MTSENLGDSDIDTLALRAKEMLERVRGGADTGASSGLSAPSKLSNLQATVEDSVDNEPVEDDTAEETSAEEPSAEETVESIETDNSVSDVDEADTVEEDTVLESVEDEAVGGDVGDLADEVERDANSELGDAIDENQTDGVSDEVFFGEDTELDSPDLTEVDTDLDAELDNAEIEDLADDDVVDAANDDIAEQIPEGADEEEWPEFSFKSKEAADEIDGDDTDISIVSDAEVIDDAEVEFEEDISINDAIVFEDYASDETTSEIEDESDTAGLGYLGGVDGSESAAINTDDLVSEIDALDTDDELLDDAIGLDLDFDAATRPDSEPVTIEGTAVVAGATAAAATIDAEPIGDSIRSRGRLSDLSSEQEVMDEPKGKFSSRRKPHVDQDLNDLFNSNDEPVGSSSDRGNYWLLPLLGVALAGIFLIIWSSGGSDADNPTPDTSAQVADDTDSDQEALEASSTTSSTTTTTSAEPDDTAWGLIGEESNTDGLAALGAPVGLQQVLQQELDSDGEPVSFTLLAPSNDALAKLSAEEADELAESQNLTRDILAYHFIDQPLTPELVARGQIITRSGEILDVEMVDDEVVFNGVARIERDDLVANNGTVLIIDTLLRPEQVGAAPTEDADVEADETTTTTSTTTTTTTEPEPADDLSDVLDLANVQFEVLSSRITPEGQAELQNAVTFFKDNPDVNALIEGHTDSDGVPAKNQTLSQQRADAVRQFLVSNGIDGARLEAQGFGQDQPILVNGVEDKVASRRIEFVLR